MASLVAPIGGASPVGVDISYDPDFEAIKAEIDKLSSVDNSEPSWGRIHELGTSLLTKKGKDLRVVSWLAVAKVKLHDWTGFAESLVLYDGVSRAFWDTMFPDVKRARPRVNAISWMAEMINTHLVSKDVSLADGDAVRAANDVLVELDQLFAEKLGDAYVGPGQLRSLLREKVRSIPEVAGEAPPPGAAPVADGNGVAAAAAAPPPAASAAPAVATATTVGDVDSTVGANADSIVRAAALLRGSDPMRAWSYRLTRIGNWMVIDGAPPVTEGRTRVPPPEEYLQRELAELRDAAKWFDLLNRAEQLTVQYLFWLDLQRYVATAMDRIGPQFLAAREVVGREVVNFVGRTPNVETLTFSDGTPFADAQTRTWLEEEARKYGGAGGGGSAASAAASAEDEEVAKRFADAQKMVAEGKVADGLSVALALADRAADGRTRFRARLAVGKMALDAGKPDLGRAMLEHLLAEVDRHGLEVWEPSTSATLYANLITATREVIRAKGGANANGGAGGSPELAALAGKEQYLFDKLCRLDPASAIKLST